MYTKRQSRRGLRSCVLSLTAFAMLPVLTGCTAVQQAYAFVNVYDIIVLAGRSITGTALLAFINGN